MNYCSTTIDYTCSSCGEEFDVEVTFGCPARTYGPPENCHPEEPPEVEPQQCPHCNHDVDVWWAEERAADRCEALREDDYERQQEEDRW